MLFSLVDFDIQISPKDFGLVYVSSFEMNRQQTYIGGWGFMLDGWEVRSHTTISSLSIWLDWVGLGQVSLNFGRVVSNQLSREWVYANVGPM